MRSHDVDVAVVGAGPAGATAAGELARSGVRVALLEREPLPRYKTCGGGLAGRALRALPARVRDVVERECFACELRASDDHLTVSDDAPLISRVMRDRLDFLLAQAAHEAGARLLAPCPVETVTTEAGGLQLKTGRGTLTTRFLVLAEGATGRLASQLGFPDGRRLIPALEAEVRVDPCSERLLGRTARFDFGSIPHGYGWVFPKKDHLSIGILSMRRGSVRLPAALERFYDFLGITQPQGEERHGYVIPVRPRTGPPARDGVLVVGDAAGFVDPVTAEGISHAVLSGQLAARALLRSKLEPGRAEALYVALAKEEILPELRCSRWLARLFYGPVGLRDAIFRRWGQELANALAGVFGGRSSYRELLPGPLRWLAPGR
jgi:geranylgeranyl reductase family protein